MIHCDVLVVGLGPAGGAAAKVAARGGLQVLCVDARASVGEPIQCGELVPLALLPECRGREVVVQRLSSMLTYLPSGDIKHLDAAGLMLDRSALDQVLAREAQALGARLMTGTRLVSWDRQSSIARLNVGGAGMDVHARMLVAADGPRSTVARLLGLSPLPMVHARQYAVPIEESQDAARFWLSPAYPGGYAWMFPRGSEANLGVGIDRQHGINPKQALDALHAELVQAGLVGSCILRRTGGQIPTGGLRSMLVLDNVLFAGDAAGLTHPVMGAGIAPALASGALAGEAAVDWLGKGRTGALSGYAEELQERYGVAYQKAVQRRKLLEDAWREGCFDDAVCRRGWFMFAEYHE